MIDHVGINVVDWDKSRAFYDAAFASLRVRWLMTVPKEFTGGANVGGYGRQRPVFWLHQTASAPGPGRHYAFDAASRAEVDAFHRAALAAGGRDNGAPGPRPHYHPDYYGAFVLDPDGNNIEAVCHRPE
jgi:catechol 2,3-dioxygenase-like lactoylglutathione lyase family enzyme